MFSACCQIIKSVGLALADRAKAQKDELQIFIYNYDFSNPLIDWMYNFMTGCTTLVAKHHNAVLGGRGLKFLEKAGLTVMVPHNV